jgi:predicted transcriptional regulator of viral defense system
LCKSCRMPDASDYIADLAAHGKWHFTTEEAVEALGAPILKVRAALRRLKAKGEVVDPHRSFHVILPPEQRPSGCAPPEQFVPPLMDHLGEPYYVALLSAAELYGAVHPHDHTLQVMTKLNRKPIDCGKGRVQFVGRKDLERTPWLERITPSGLLRVASPEATALELVGYVDQCGGLENVAHVLDELVDALNPEKLVAAAPLGPIAWAQRLGYLLDLTEHRNLSNVLAPLVKDLANDFTPLVRARPKAGATRLTRWKLAVNASV